MNRRPVEMGDGDDLPSHEVVETIDGVGVDETVSYPQSSLGHLLDFSYILNESTGQNHQVVPQHTEEPNPDHFNQSYLAEHISDPVLCNQLRVILCFFYLRLLKPQNEEGLIRDDRHQITVIRPEHL